MIWSARAVAWARGSSATPTLKYTTSAASSMASRVTLTSATSTAWRACLTGVSGIPTSSVPTRRPVKKIGSASTRQGWWAWRSVSRVGRSTENPRAESGLRWLQPPGKGTSRPSRSHTCTTTPAVITRSGGMETSGRWISLTLTCMTSAAPVWMSVRSTCRISKTPTTLYTAAPNSKNIPPVTRT